MATFQAETGIPDWPAFLTAVCIGMSPVLGAALFQARPHVGEGLPDTENELGPG